MVIIYPHPVVPGQNNGDHVEVVPTRFEGNTYLQISGVRINSVLSECRKSHTTTATIVVRAGGKHWSCFCWFSCAAKAFAAEGSFEV